jgi:hypothetical protein
MRALKSAYVETDDESIDRMAKVSMVMPTNCARPVSAAANMESFTDSFLSLTPTRADKIIEICLMKGRQDELSSSMDADGGCSAEVDASDFL